MGANKTLSTSENKAGSDMPLHLENPPIILRKVHMSCFKSCAARTLMLHCSSGSCIVAKRTI